MMPKDSWNFGYGMRIDPDELELRGIRSFVRRRYDDNKEFIPAEEVYEIVLSYCKWYRAENKRLNDVVIQNLEYNLRYNISPFELICPPFEKK